MIYLPRRRRIDQSQRYVFYVGFDDAAERPPGAGQEGAESEEEAGSLGRAGDALG